MKHRPPSSLSSLIVALAVAVAGCSREPAAIPATGAKPSPPGRPTIYTVNYPLAYFAQRVGGDEIAVVFPMSEPGDPATWQPDSRIISAYQRADLILLNSPGYAPWVDKATLPPAALVDTSARFKAGLIRLAAGQVHSHGPSGAHSHAGYAPTTWLDPRLARGHAAAIAEQLAGLLPGAKDVFTQRLAVLEADLNDWQREFEHIVATRRDMPVIASHPVYQYLERFAQLNWRSVHWEPAQPPTAEQWQELVDLLTNHPARWMVWEDEPLPATRRRLESELGLASVVFHPSAFRSPLGDYLETMRSNLEALRPIYAAP